MSQRATESKQDLLKKLISSYNRDERTSYAKNAVRSLQCMLARERASGAGEIDFNDLSQTSKVRKRKRDSELLSPKTLPPTVYVKFQFDSKGIRPRSRPSYQKYGPRLAFFVLELFSKN